MTKRLITLMAALLVLGGVAVGCGDDDGGSGNSGSNAADTAAQTVTDTDTVTDDEVVTETETDVETVTEETDTTDTTATSDDGGAVAPPENLEQAVEQCKRGVNATPQLSDDAKADLEDICEKAASGDRDDVREAAIEVCQKVIEDTWPDGTPGRQRALDACDRQ